MKAVVLGMVVAGVLAVGAGGEARADWYYTKWGMTPAEVVSASGGTAKETTNDEKAKAHISDLTQAKLTAPVTIDLYKFNATFYFDVKSDALFRVSLALFNKDFSGDLSNSMLRKYGKPMETRSSQVMTTMTWQTDIDHIEMSIIASQQSVTSVSIKYTPRFSSDNSKL